MREKPKDINRLLHIREAIHNIREFTANVNKEEFLTDKMRYFAIVKNLEIVGEAAYMLTNDFKEKYISTPWRDIVRLRHILVHGYYQLEPEILWQTIITDLNILYSQIISYIEDMEASNRLGKRYF